MKQFLLIFSIFYALLAYNPLHINITNLLKDFKFISALQNYKVTWHQLKDGSIVDIRQSEKNGETTKRRTPVESEKYVGEQLGDKAEAQVSFKDGESAKRGTSGSVRPDFCATDGSCSIEVKNYDIANNQNALINKVAEQAIQREVNLPAGMRQEVRIDISGQSVSGNIQTAIKQKIVEKSNGIIKFDDIKFFK